MEKSSQKASFGQGLELAIIILKAFTTIVKKIGLSSSGIQNLIDKPGIIYKCVENLFSNTAVLENLPILKLISVGEKIIIEPLDGKRLISQAKKVFKAGIDPDCIAQELTETSTATSETSLDVYEMSNDATFEQIFSEINSKLDKIVMTKSQIIRFCEKYQIWMRNEGSGTFF